MSAPSEQDREGSIALQESNPQYICSVCNATVIVYDGRTFKTCDHSDAPVIANMQAILQGSGGVV